MAVLGIDAVAETLVCATESEEQDSRTFPVATMCCATKVIRNRFLQSIRTEESMISVVPRADRGRAGFVDTRLTSVFCSVAPGTPHSSRSLNVHCLAAD